MTSRKNLFTVSVGIPDLNISNLESDSDNDDDVWNGMKKMM